MDLFRSAKVVLRNTIVGGMVVARVRMELLAAAARDRSEDGALAKPRGDDDRRADLAAEAVEGAALALEGVDDVHGGDGLPAGVLGVGDGVTDHVLEEHLEDTAGLLVDEARDALDTATASQAADGGLGDALDVVAEHLAVTLGAALSESFTSLSTS